MQLRESCKQGQQFFSQLHHRYFITGHGIGYFVASDIFFSGEKYTWWVIAKKLTFIISFVNLKKRKRMYATPNRFFSGKYFNNVLKYVLVQKYLH